MARSGLSSGRVVLLTGAGGPVAAMTERLPAHGARAATAGALCHLLARRPDRAHGPVLVLTEGCSRWPRAA
jgi:hypothetical protein